MSRDESKLKTLIRCYFHQIYHLHWGYALETSQRYHVKGCVYHCVNRMLKKMEIHQPSGELQRERGKFQSQQLSLLTHFNLGKPDVRLPTHDFVGRCKGWSVLETDVRLFFPRPSECDMDAINITGCIHNGVIVPGLGSIGIHRHATLLRLYLKTCTWLRMENKLVTRWREMRNPTGSQQTHLDGQKAFFRKQSLCIFWKNVEMQLIFNLHNPFAITRLIFTSGLS